MSNSALQRLEYRDAARPTSPTSPSAQPSAAQAAASPAPPPGFTEQEVAARVLAAVHEAEKAAERRWAAEAQQQEARRHDQLHRTIQAFAEERQRYFRDAETEVVHLALAVARKILCREAMLDPELLLGLVRVALDRMNTGPVVKVRVAPSERSEWHQSKAFNGAAFACDVVPDAGLHPGECVIETDLGTAEFGLEAHFKQIEQGMMDLLALRPHTPAEPTPNSTDILAVASSQQTQADLREASAGYP